MALNMFISRYQYQAIHAQGSCISGSIWSFSPHQARRLLEKKYAQIVHLQKAHWITGQPIIICLSETDLALLAEQWSYLMKGGLSLLKSLSYILEQGRISIQLKHALERIHQQLIRGHNLSETFFEQRETWGVLFCSVIVAGEIASALPEALTHYSQWVKNANRLRSLIRKAFVYPAFVCIIGLALWLAFLIWILPSFVHLLKP